MDSINSMMTIFNVVIGIYCLYAAISGKGAAYKNEYPESIKEPARKSMRLLLAVVGPLTLAMGICEYFHVFGDANATIQLIGIGVLLALIIGYIVWFRVKFRKELKNPKIKKVQ